MNEASPAPVPVTKARDTRDTTQRENIQNVNIRNNTIREKVDTVKQINDQGNQINNRHIIVLSLSLILFGVAVGMGTLYLCYWINVDSGMSKYKIN